MEATATEDVQPAQTRPARKWRRFWPLFVGLGLLAAGIVLFAATAASIYFYDPAPPPEHADAAIILGAALLKNEPSPVFKERINHAVRLYKQGVVGKLVFTGGLGEGSKLSDSVVAARYAMRNGVPEADILLEKQSRTTLENLTFAIEVTRDRGLESFLIVSDPIHMKRSMLMARDLGMKSWASPTDSTRYRGFSKRMGFLLKETQYHLRYQLFRTLGI